MCGQKKMGQSSVLIRFRFININCWIKGKLKEDILIINDPRGWCKGTHVFCKLVDVVVQRAG